MTDEHLRSFQMNAAIPSADLFFRARPAEDEGPAEAWRLARTVIDYGCALFASKLSLREDRRVRDAVLAALLRRTLVTAEGIVTLLSHGLVEPALALTRTLLDLYTSFRLIERDDTDRMAKRLAAFHYLAYQEHGQDMLSNRPTREGVLRTSGRIPEVIEVAKSYARHLESPAFDEIRAEVKGSQFWHGFSSAEEALRAVGQESEYHMTYDSASWFVHAVNVDHDYLQIGDGTLAMRPLVERDPKVIQPLLGYAVLRTIELLRLYCVDRGLDLDGPTGASASLVEEDGSITSVSSLTALELMALKNFDVRPDGFASRTP